MARRQGPGRRYLHQLVGSGFAGNRRDYDDWAASGATGWGYESLLPYFRRSESFEGGADEYRGGDGPVSVSRLRTPHELVDVFVAAGVEAGFGANADPNGADPEGFAARAGPISGRGGGRPRPGVPGARAGPPQPRDPHRRRGQPAVAGRGALYRRGDRRRRTAASREVVLSAGAIMSPKLLMLSGIGPRPELAGLGIDVVVEAEGVAGTSRSIRSPS